jgi:phage/plasmid-like protein (TIGR03299 family)
VLFFITPNVKVSGEYVSILLEKIMAHNLNIRNGKASMAYYGEEPWHGLGKKLEKPATAKEAIKAASLDWEVRKVPLSASYDRYTIKIKDKFGVVRKDMIGKDDCKVFGIVGSQYEPLQNREAFDFFDPIVGKNAAVYHTAGVLGDGERIWILAKLPDNIYVIGDDISEKYLLLSNSHDGKSAVQIKFTPIRVVCQNTLTMALSDGQITRIIHTNNMHQCIKQADKILGIIRERYADIEASFKRMAQIKMHKERLSEYLSLVFPDPSDPENERQVKQIKENRSLAEYFFDQGAGNRIKGVSGTLWAAYNGVTEFIDHRRTARQTMDRRLNSIWFGDGYLTKVRAFTIANDKSETWLN